VLSAGCVDVISIGELQKWANTGAFCVCVCVFRREHNSFTADVKGVRTNDMVTVLVRPVLRLYKNGKYDWPSHVVITIIIIIIIIIIIKETHLRTKLKNRTQGKHISI
jgi:hypothetical protein